MKDDLIFDIYKVGALTYPKIFQCNNGSKFKAEVTKMLEKCGFMIQRVTMNYKHMHTAFIEALNKLLIEQLFKVQDVQELNNVEKVLSTWMRYMYGLKDRLNDTETQMTGMKPEEAIELKKVLLVESYHPGDTLPEDGSYHYLLQPGEEHDDQHKRTTDRI